METDFVPCRFALRVSLSLASTVSSSHFMTFDMNNLINYCTNCPEFSFKRFYCLNGNKLLMCTHSRRKKAKPEFVYGCALHAYEQHIDAYTYTHA